ncbi:MAG: bifunctional riboflavin kinase/FAD synthetase [Alphaproteobacteria bacterium]|nr:MAG: bifunctional riboflavin kinase/FAD synthetase [Alphaproteobacteria bacterium]
MDIIRDFEFVEPEHRGAAAAIGNFDGVHLGHQAVISLARDVAEAEGWPLGVVTFEPHPRRFFQPDAPPFRLMNAAARAHRLARLGVAKLYELPFNHHLAGLGPDAFVDDVLHRALGLRHVVVGADFRFGKGRAGDAAFLEARCARHGIGVTVAPLLTLPEGEISSTAIRKALAEGRCEDARRMLGHWHRIDGVVEPGDQRGRELGFPTANIPLGELHRPRFGVYAVLVDVLDGPHAGSHKGVASIGVRPMFDGDEPNLEVHVFDFAGDLYGHEISVALVRFLRDEARFESVEALVAQMHRDAAEARAALEGL